jgi:hypothetical protein
LASDITLYAGWYWVLGIGHWRLCQLKWCSQPLPIYLMRKPSRPGYERLWYWNRHWAQGFVSAKAVTKQLFIHLLREPFRPWYERLWCWRGWVSRVVKYANTLGWCISERQSHWANMRDARSW